MMCLCCTGTTDSHNAACPLHPDMIEMNDQRLMNSDLAMQVRMARALERIAQHPGGSPRRYAALCSRGDYQRGTGCEVWVLVSANSVEDAARQLAIPMTFRLTEPNLPMYDIKSISPWDQRLHGPWIDSPYGLAEQDEKKIPNPPVTR